jgi:hypothetical protein
MTTKTLDKALTGFDVRWTCPIFAILARYAPVLYGGASQNQVAEIALQLSQVSGGAGLSIVSLFMWPDDENLPDSIAGMVDDVQEKIKNYQGDEPGQEYGI